jgi:predicted O-methyltransferase YrrM
MLTKTMKLLERFPAGQFVPDDVECYDEAEIQAFAKMLSRLVYAPSKLRKVLQEHGTSITRADFYGELPLISEIERSFAESTNLVLEDIFGDNEALLEVLRELTAYSIEFDPPAKASSRDEFAWDHGPFSYSDAMGYYSMIRRHKPKTIVELGCGTSTLVAMQALEKNGGGRLVALEPFPSDFLRQMKTIELLTIPAQKLEREFLQNTLDDGDILFIDTTHAVRHNSDVLHIYLRLLPAIRKNIVVHVHDIYLPGPLPIHMMRDQQVYWNEQYVLYAYLLRNPSVRVLYGSAYHSQKNPEQLARFMHGRCTPGGASFWFSQSAE